MSAEEAGRAIKSLLQQRQAFLARRGITDQHHLMTGDERVDCIRHCKEEYEREPLQRELQDRDLEEGGKKLERQRKHSRFSREWQRRCGSKQVAEVILFSGRWDADLLRQAMATDGASQRVESNTDAAATAHRRRVRLVAIEAKYKLRQGRHLARAAARGAMLGLRELAMVREFESGHLRTKANDAVKAYGHGRLHARDGSHMDIGGNTGGLTRRLLDSYVIPSHENFPTE